MGRSLRIWNQLAPVQADGTPGDPLAYREFLDFSTLSEININLYDQISQNEIGFVQSLYVDNKANGANLVIVSGVVEQNITIPAGAQAYVPVMTSDPPVFKFTTTAVAGLVVPVFFCNVPFASVMLNGSVRSIKTETDISGTIAVGGTAQTISAANAAGRRVIIYNPTSQVESLFVNTTGSATSPTTNSFELVPGGYYDSVDPITNAISVNAATAGHIFIAKLRS